MKRFSIVFALIFLIVSSSNIFCQSLVLLKNTTLIDGTGKQAQEKVDVLIKDDKIVEIGPSKKSYPATIKVIDLSGKTIIPMLINTHGHVGLLKGTKTTATNYTKENVVSQLLKYEKYGVGSVVSLGTDRELIFQLRDSSLAGKLPGAYVYTAGYGFTTKGGGPSTEGGMDLLFRPVTADEAIKNVQQLAALKPDIIKIWVDNFGGSSEKIQPEIYASIIKEAHRQQLRVATHLYYLADAHSLVNAGADVFAHSIRDKEVDDALINAMKSKNIVYIPTLSLDKFAYAYGTKPEWLNDTFFKASLEPGVFEMINNDEYRNKVASASNYQKNIKAFETALANVKKLYDAGILIGLGTDSGAQAVRTQGFSEHLELELLTQAGLTPLQAITVGTKNGAQILGVSKKRGTLEIGKKADFIILNKNPSKDIKATREIEAVWKNGKLVSKGPL